MIGRLTEILKDPRKLSLLVAVFFCVGILLSAYFLGTLRSELQSHGGLADSPLTTAVFVKVFVVVGITLILGILAVNQAMKVKREIVVFKEKDNTIAQDQMTKSEQASSVDMQSFKNDIKNEKGLKAWQVGLNSLCRLLQAGQGALYLIRNKDGSKVAELAAGFALIKPEGETIQYQAGEGLVGQLLASGKNMYLDELPEGYQNQITSGLGMAAPKFLYLMAIKKENEVKAILEIATFTPVSGSAQKQAEEMGTLLLEKI